MRFSSELSAIPGYLWCHTAAAPSIFANIVRGTQPLNQPYNRDRGYTIDLILSVHVDDILVAGRNQETINAFKAELQKHFQITELGPIKNYLGLQFESTYTEAGQRMLTIHQERYIEELLVRFGMKECKTRASPLDSHIKLESVVDRTTPIDPKRLKEYREMIGSLTHCMQGTRPDIAFAVSLLSRALVNPSEEHIRHVKHIMRYLRGVTKLGVTYRSNAEGQFDLHAYTDADFAGGALPDGKSTSGYIFFLAGGPISWQSKKTVCGGNIYYRS